ncbi:MAG: prolipoprotein diacylglyceryl transferase [Bacteroides sp.]|nr:prolipoprotein diacylglyceryl transferase [Prevotella sp.]MCM1407509.1 prolipoprotein diacylglyceryl transferase [Treponema brennaborense]MCM1469999.1 prolipoprotein diacylglyceryl transferase [Bacteroides sp.]
MFLAINYPSWISPQIFPGVPVLGIIRWYGLMYIFAFAAAFAVMRREFRAGALDSAGQKTTEDELFNFFAFSILFLLIGARLFSTLIYDTSGLYRKKPWLIFWPFDEHGTFTGLAGMSYHGGALGGMIGMTLWCLMHKKPVLKWTDAMAAAIPLGYTFGRIGNFLNGELCGRITTMPWGMFFPYAERFSASLPWVREFAENAGITIPAAGLVNLPRHPSQLYEAFFEGIVLWFLLSRIRKCKPFEGCLTGLYFAGYGAVRFVIEYFREPDIDIGYRLAADPDAPTYINTSLLNFSTGQVLCFLMIAAGIALITACAVRAKKRRT